MIAVVDYGRGNLFSIGQALRHLGTDYHVTDEPDAVLECDNAENELDLGAWPCP